MMNEPVKTSCNHHEPMAHSIEHSDKSSSKRRQDNCCTKRRTFLSRSSLTQTISIMLIHTILISSLMVTISKGAVTPSSAVTSNQLRASDDDMIVENKIIRYHHMHPRIKNLISVKLSTAVFRIIYDEKTGSDIIVGGRNYIYRLSSSDLSLLDLTKTGPVNDSILCKPYPEECKYPRSLVDNDNQVLIIKYDSRPSPIVISCGSVNQGMCSFHKHVKFNHTAHYGSPSDPVNYVASSKRTIAFFTRAPSDQTSSSVLFVASESDNRPDEFSPPSVSSRSIQFGIKTAMHFTHYDLRENTKSAVDVAPAIKKSYYMSFIYGFSDDNYAYFITIQPVSLSSSDYETRISRICLNDTSFNSYSEIPIVCDDGSITYNIATTGHYGKGINGFKQFNTGSNALIENVLYVSFMSGFSKRGSDVNIERGSVICSYNMRDINQKINHEITECSKGYGKRNGAFYGSNINCMIEANFDARSDKFCSKSTTNNFVEGSEPVVSEPIMRPIPYARIVSLITFIQNDRDVIGMIGTETASSTEPNNKTSEVLKILMASNPVDPSASSTSSPSNYILFRQQLVNMITEDVNQSGKVAKDSSEGKKSKRRNLNIRSDPVLDMREEFLFLASDDHITKFPVKSCSIYADCGKCLSTKDPLGCGWCSSFCGSASECRSGNNFNRTSCTPVIYDFEPKSGPTSGNTILKIFGDNFGGSGQIFGDQVKTSVKLGDTECEIIKWSNDMILCKTLSSSRETMAKISVFTDDRTKSTISFDIYGSAVSDGSFEYVTPRITGIYPEFGPVSGGTKLILTGDHLNCGSQRTIIIGNTPCTEESSDDRQVVCITGKSSFVPLDSSDIRSPVFMSIDKFNITTGLHFVYKDDPYISDMYPKGSIETGRIAINVYGKNLKSITRPRMIIKFQSDRYPLLESPCDVKNKTYMVCMSPAMISGANKDTKKPILNGNDYEPASVSFMSDDIKISQDKKSMRITYYPNPDFYKFKDGQQNVHLEDPIVEIPGANLHHEYDVKIYVGSHNFTCDILPDKSETHKLRCRIDFREFKPNENDAVVVNYSVGDFHGTLGNALFIHKPDDDSNTAVILSILVVAFIILVSCAACIVYCMKKNGMILTKKHPSFQVIYSSQRSQDNLRTNDYGNRFHDGDSRLPLIGSNVSAAAAEAIFRIDDETMSILIEEKKLIAREYLEVGEPKGKGHFGCVFKGKLTMPIGKDGSDEFETTEVAVKTIQSNWVSSQQMEMFLKEALIMKDFCHEHVLNLIGVCFNPDDGSPLVIIPFMPNGDVLTYIRDEKNHPTVKDLITFGTEIAQGMEYLADKKFVHRDLAARNCMLTADFRVKVADFGLSRDVYEQEYYKSDKNMALPIKWMAPESLENGSYSVKSDVWSYGITLWELLTRGVLPYPQVGNWDMVPFLKQGRRLPKPDCCPNPLYLLMLRCWLYDPKDRPTFSHLVKEVPAVIRDIEDRIRARQVALGATYQNFPVEAYYQHISKGGSPENFDVDDDNYLEPVSPGRSSSYMMSGGTGAATGVSISPSEPSSTTVNITGAAGGDVSSSSSTSATGHVISSSNPVFNRDVLY